MKINASGPSNGPLLPTATAFFDLMNEIETFQCEHTEHLDFEHYEALSESAVVLRTLGNLRICDDPISYFVSRLDDAASELAYYRQLV